MLCLYGKAVGQGGGSECRSAEKDFFNILKKKKGSIRWSKTFDARKAFLNQCEPPRKSWRLNSLRKR
ncbi:hypothetical protein AW102_25515 [Escherichia coli]|nr:hypothetical protein AW068_24005 [Escherichia coli]OTC94238.1 hypothetical protein AW087_24460 [Escherichia coli]OTD63652.1 hypothetical protein AW102_25515 [Escherichia coli]